MMLVVVASLALCLSAFCACAKEVAQQTRGTVAPSESKDNIVLSESDEQTMVSVEIKMYSQDYAAPRYLLTGSEIETLKQS